MSTATKTKEVEPKVNKPDGSAPIKAKFSKDYPNASKINVLPVGKGKFRVNVYEQRADGELGFVKLHRIVHSEFVIAG